MENFEIKKKVFEYVINEEIFERTNFSLNLSLFVRVFVLHNISLASLEEKSEVNMHVHLKKVVIFLF